ncbi:hypothetical protein [Dysgonomonas sp. GY617]|uniref:hypothetical protein n=1 Tax=Dysgonomonas sp. GY617 TaxID=2780420 RepID=UPI001883DEB1|nr:hypothetical protein [Dysgonomonas sp. GY617]MBF0577142.1 hypothetical protein [Dysgonomonas sp. GY617]
MKIKKKISLIMIMHFAMGLLYCQVGINTKDPIGLFHIDHLFNTSGSIGLLDDFIVADDGNGGVSAALGGIPSANASLSMNDPNQGFLLNRVKLTSTTDHTTVPNPVEGMLVFNTARMGVFPYNTIPGIYLYNGSIWLKMETSSYTGLRDRILLKTDLTLQQANAVSALETSVLDFGDLLIKEDGGYAFSLNLDINASSTVNEIGGNASNSILRSQMYVFLYKKSLGETTFSKVDVAELNTPMYRGTNRITTNVILGCIANAGDYFQIRVGCTLYYMTGILNKTSTSVIYWKV